MRDEAIRYLDEVRARVDGATPGPWALHGTWEQGEPGYHIVSLTGESANENGTNVVMAPGDDYTIEPSEGDALLMAHSRADMDRLERFARKARGVLLLAYECGNFPDADEALAILRGDK